MWVSLFLSVPFCGGVKAKPTEKPPFWGAAKKRRPHLLSRESRCWDQNNYRRPRGPSEYRREPCMGSKALAALLEPTSCLPNPDLIILFHHCSIKQVQILLISLRGPGIGCCKDCPTLPGHISRRGRDQGSVMLAQKEPFSRLSTPSSSPGCRALTLPELAFQG